jgi:hypothetical protein
MERQSDCSSAPDSLSPLFAIAAWSVKRSQEAFGDGDHRGAGFLLGDDAVEVDDPIGWEPLARRD